MFHSSRIYVTDTIHQVKSYLSFILPACRYMHPVLHCLTAKAVNTTTFVLLLFLLVCHCWQEIKWK